MFGRQDCHGGDNITGMPLPLPLPCSIMQNPGKTVVLPVSPLVAALSVYHMEVMCIVNTF
jgi:hypothetical protein